MTLNVAAADQIEIAEVAIDTEKRDTAAFFAIVAALLATVVIAGLTFGLGGVGMIAILAAGSMLAICIALTAG